MPLHSMRALLAVMKRSPLIRRTALRSKPRPVDRSDPARQAWKTSHGGYCQCGCERWTWHLERHHVVALADVKREGRLDLAWDLRNAMDLHPTCHANHTSASRRILIERVPVSALAFAVELLGEDRAAIYLARQYRADVSRRAA